MSDQMDSSKTCRMCLIKYKHTNKSKKGEVNLCADCNAKLEYKVNVKL